MTVTSAEALRWATTYLEGCGIASARLDAEVLLAHCVGWERTALYREPSYGLTSDEDTRFQALVERRGAHEPLAYLTGEREFWSLPFAIRRGVLIPRPDTEWVVETALRYAQQLLRTRLRCRVLDIGTGSGNIAVAVATSLEAIDVTAVDISPVALEVAHRNAQSCQVAARVQYVRGDCLGPFSPRRARFDLLLSNPPYIAAAEWPTLPTAVRCYEPHEALDGGRDGLRFYRRLFAEGPQYIADDGIAIVEVGYRQAGDVSRLLVQSQQWELLETVQDYSGIDRVVVAQHRREGSGSAWITSKSKVGSNFTGTSA
ncbi:MAG TPA: peptide chain release factor N(5)-glutamine methyltransferase [Candidatus Tectomicrobia bacterium]|nr:peptide chain release factor N(5)-glutamine methyltransferase [Candidatus Tectomicrobia bacterium]